MVLLLKFLLSNVHLSDVLNFSSCDITGTLGSITLGGATVICTLGDVTITGTLVGATLGTPLGLIFVLGLFCVVVVCC